MLFGLLLAAVVFSRPMADPIWYAERGWALLMGAWFLIAGTLRPEAEFFSRALTALGLSLGTAVLLLLAGPGMAGWSGLDWEVTSRIHSDLGHAGAFAVERFGADSFPGRVAAAATHAGDFTAMLYPAMLGLASLAGLGVAWWAYRRLNGFESQPLGRLGEFRFQDGMLWLVVFGLLLVVSPLGQEFARSGWNLLFFTGALYGLRGVAVTVALYGWPGPLGLIIGGVVVLLLYPVVLAAMILLGLIDSWLDLRLRQRG